MSRVTFVTLVTLMTAGSSSAFACCGGPAVYAPAPVVYGAPAPVAVPVPTPVAVPVPTPVAVPVPTPVAVPVAAGCGCGSPAVYAAPLVAPIPVAPAPIYVVNQGPDYSGPGIMVPYRTWSRAAAWTPATGYPYVYGHRYVHRYFYHRHVAGPRYSYHTHGYLRPVHWRRPVNARG